MAQAAFIGSGTLCWETVIIDEVPVCVPESNVVVSGSPNVKINGNGAAIVGSGTSHPCSVISGSSSVFINGSPASRVGDLLSCSCENNRGHIVSGSNNVSIGG